MPKPDGSVRLCGDFKVTVSPSLEIETHPLPNPEDLFATLAGGVMFSESDLAHAYQQVLLDDESLKYVTVNTPRGLFQHTRLPFGIASAPAVFQEIADKLLQEIPGVLCYLHDILISGSTAEEHDKRLEMVLVKILSPGFVRRGQIDLVDISMDPDSELKWIGHNIDHFTKFNFLWPQKTKSHQKLPETLL